MQGGDKLLETIEGVPLLRRQAVAAMTTGCPVVVTLPPNAVARRDTLSGLALRIDEVADASEGMSASLRQIAGLLGPGQSLGIVLPDVPGLECGDILNVLEAFRAKQEDRIVRGGMEGSDRPGTPIFLPHSVAKGFADLTGDDGGRSVIGDEDITFVRFPDDRAIRDLDTPEDWEAWRKETGIPS